MVILAREYCHDFQRFVRHSASFDLNTKEKLTARIVRQCHIIEKGLALREPAETLSRFRVRPLMNDIELYISKHGCGPLTQCALSALRDLGQFLVRENIISADGFSAETLMAWVSDVGEISECDDTNSAYSSTRKITREAIHVMAKRDLSSFFDSRHSIRQFEKRKVDDELIEKAIQIACTSPSACNRQPWKVYVIREPYIRQRALALQGGNRGFGDQADVILIVTGNLSATLHFGERMQPWLDGGMFAMSLIYGLHSLGLGTCCLNWSKNRRTDRKLRETVGIPDNEVVLLMIAIGHLPQQFEVASSPRYPLRDVMVKVEGTNDTLITAASRKSE